MFLLLLYVSDSSSRTPPQKRGIPLLPPRQHHHHTRPPPSYPKPQPHPPLPRDGAATDLLLPHERHHSAILRRGYDAMTPRPQAGDREPGVTCRGRSQTAQARSPDSRLTPYSYFSVRSSIYQAMYGMRHVIRFMYISCLNYFE